MIFFFITLYDLIWIYPEQRIPLVNLSRSSAGGTHEDSQHNHGNGHDIHVDLRTSAGRNELQLPIPRIAGSLPWVLATLGTRWTYYGHMRGILCTYEGYIMDIWGIYYGYMRGILWTYEGYIMDIWGVYYWYMRGILWIYEGYIMDIWGVYYGYMRDIFGFMDIWGVYYG